MDGVVEGTISLPENRLTVGPNAHVHADVDARDVVIFGSVEGNLHATGRVELRESAMVQGDIFASRLSIEENASIRGKIDMSATAVSVPAVRLPETHAAAGNDAAMDLS